MTAELFYDVDMGLIWGASVILFILITEAGYRLGRRSRDRIDDYGKSQLTTIQGAILGLLALLLGFTFAMAMSRFDVRKQLVLDEANAIGTTYLRAQLFPEPQRQEASNLLRRYVDVRLEFYRANNNQEKLREAKNQTEQLLARLWSLGTAWGQAEPRALPMGLFLQSLNDVIDLNAKRQTAMDNHVPEIILILLYFVAMAAMGVLGYGGGLGGGRNHLINLVVPIIIAAVILVIIDLDRPRRGLIKVSQQSMMDLRQSLGGTKP
jgi:hypothetical protein